MQSLETLWFLPVCITAKNFTEHQALTGKNIFGHYKKTQPENNWKGTTIDQFYILNKFNPSVRVLISFLLQVNCHIWCR